MMDRRCAWCRELLSATRSDARFCGRRCRQTAFRLRRRRTTEAAAARPMVFAYADPPYPGLSWKYYRDEPSFGGEVDHAELIASLQASGYAGWALSTGAYALRDILPMCPPGARVCAWVKPIGVSSKTFGLHNAWEPLVVVGGRQRPPGRRDWLRAHPARGGGRLPGRKPIAFCAWLFDCLGMLPGDELVDLFPGTGVIGRAWVELSAPSPGDPSDAAASDVSAGAGGNASPKYSSYPSSTPGGHPSQRSSGDTSPGAQGDTSFSCRGDTPASPTPRGNGLQFRRTP